MKKGFTLIELMIVIAVIAILATISLFGLRQAQASARDTQRLQIMNSVRASLERYFANKGAYPDASQKFTDLMGASGSLSYAPDPTDPGCGSAAPTTIAAQKIAGAGDWCPCDTTPTAGCMALGAGIAQPRYSYLGGTPANGYTLTLTKESGGQSKSTGPQ